MIKIGKDQHADIIMVFIWSGRYTTSSLTWIILLFVVNFIICLKVFFSIDESPDAGKTTISEAIVKILAENGHRKSEHGTVSHGPLNGHVYVYLNCASMEEGSNVPLLLP
mmetsp:Transcript_4772/g.9729  ORF Transcript_4772/g.9729 Transcript_4772/m.9729 type:complete len:110 (+) Transcript_4772:345-674(+)